MANQEQLAMLKQRVKSWNEWRQRYPTVEPDLSHADLNGANLIDARLSYADLSGADLSGAFLTEARLNGADLSGAIISGASLIGANLGQANLRETTLTKANLREATLAKANLHEAILTGANLYDADLRKANLIGANLREATLNGADLSGVTLWATIFADNDLRAVKGLVEILHKGPSRVELHTVKLPQDGSALHFLRGAGIPNEWIDLYRAQMMSPIQYHSCFISYSSKDDVLAHRLHADLQDQGVRCWFAPEDMKIGDKIRVRIDEAIHLQDKLLLLLSEHAIASTWVEDEVEAALEKERLQHREVLFPVRLDEQVMQTTQSWAAKLRRTRHIGDFTSWTDPQAYQSAFDRLLRDLKTGSGTKEKVDNKTELS